MSAAEPKTCIALIPARSGSKRLPHKNIAMLSGHPLIAYTIASAQQSGIFGRVIVSTDNEEYAEIARYYGADTPFMRPSKLSQDKSPDIEWVQHALQWLGEQGEFYDAFSLLRPTSPARKPETIQRAWRQFSRQESADSLRAVELCSQHPGKMWIVKDDRMHPLMPMIADGMTPYHSTQYAALPKVYVQNASLEIAWSRTALDKGSIAGEVITPFLTVNEEGYDVNSVHDWQLLEKLVERGAVSYTHLTLPTK